MLDKAPILIVEDETLIARDLAQAVNDAGGSVVGPVGSAREALSLIDTEDVKGAILDFQVSDGEVTPVIDALESRHIPMVIGTGFGQLAFLQNKHPGLTVYEKPVPSKLVVMKLDELLR